MTCRIERPASAIRPVISATIPDSSASTTSTVKTVRSRTGARSRRLGIAPMFSKMRWSSGSSRIASVVESTTRRSTSISRAISVKGISMPPETTRPSSLTEKPRLRSSRITACWLGLPSNFSIISSNIALQLALGARRVRPTIVDPGRIVEGAREGFEQGLDLVVGVLAVDFRVDGQPGVHRHRFDEMSRHVAGELADIVLGKLAVEDEVRPAADIDDDRGEGLIKWDAAVGIPDDPPAVAECLVNRFPKGDRHVFDGVVVVDI